MSKKLEECAKAKFQLKVTELFSSAEGSESEGANKQFKKVFRKRSVSQQVKTNNSYPPPKKTD